GPALEEQGRALRRLAEDTPRLLADQLQDFRQITAEILRNLDQHMLQTGQGLDKRLEAMHSELVHVESFYQTLGRLGSLYESVTASVTALGLDRWKVQEYEGLLRYLRRCHYEAACRGGALEVPVVETEHPLAADSDDTRFPRGAKNDNSICL